MFTLQWLERDDAPRWRNCRDAARVRAAAAEIVSMARKGEVRLTDLAEGWSVTTNVGVLAAWPGGPPPRALLACATEAEHENADGRGRFMRAVRAACAMGVMEGILDPHSAEALAAIAERATLGEGPAAAAPDLDAVRPARLSGAPDRD